MCLNNLPEVALDSASAGLDPAISSRESNAITITPQVVNTEQAYIHRYNIYITHVMYVVNDSSVDAGFKQQFGDFLLFQRC